MTAKVTQILPSRNSKIREARVRITNTNTFLKLPIRKLFAVENTYHVTNETDEKKGTKL